MGKLSSNEAKEEWLRESLIKLLESDFDVRKLVLQIVDSSAAVEPVSEPEPLIMVPLATQDHYHKDPLSKQLSRQLALLETVSDDQGLKAVWFVEGENQGQQLTRLLAIAAQWERLLELWDLLAERCKSQSRPANAAEVRILEGCLAIHNLIWRDRQAQLLSADVGVEYDYRQHQRSTLRGDVITEQWLFGLANAGGERQRLPLTATE